MREVKMTPGPNAHAAFRHGMILAAIAGLLCLAGFYWYAQMPPTLVGFTLFTVYPIYLVFAASALSVWLGFNKDATDLRPVYREKQS